MEPGMRACFELASTIKVQAASEEMAGQTILETPEIFLMEDEQANSIQVLLPSVTPPVPARFLTAVARDLTGVRTGIGDITSGFSSNGELAGDWAATSTTPAQMLGCPIPHPHLLDPKTALGRRR